VAVRTKQLANGVATTTLTTVYTVPAGETCILKSLAAYNPTGGATTALFLRAVIGGNNRGLLLLPGMAANSSLYGEVWIVLMAGDSLQISATPSSAVQFVLSGTELEGVAD
jgi:hypothetical protein